MMPVRALLWGWKERMELKRASQRGMVVLCLVALSLGRGAGQQIASTGTGQREINQRGGKLALRRHLTVDEQHILFHGKGGAKAVANHATYELAVSAIEITDPNLPTQSLCMDLEQQLFVLLY